MNLKLNKKIFVISAAIASLSAATNTIARDFCNRDDLATIVKACMSVSAPSDYQKGGIDDLFKGRFCAKGDLARDGLFRCLGENQDAIKTLLGCAAPTVLEISASTIPENDARKPASCN